MAEKRISDLSPSEFEQLLTTTIRKAIDSSAPGTTIQAEDIVRQIRPVLRGTADGARRLISHDDIVR